MACYECDDVCHPLCDTPRVDNRMDAKHKKRKNLSSKKKKDHLRAFYSYCIE